MAWAEKLPSGRWRGSYRDAFGKTRSAGTYRHKAEAVRRANARELEVRRTLVRDADAHRRTWGDWCAEWWPSRPVQPGTLKRDESRRDVHLLPKWEHVPLGAITRHDVKAWAGELRTKVGPSTVQRIIHLFSASLNAAVDAEILAANPAARIKLPPPPPARERWLTPEEYWAVVEQLPTTDDQLIAHVLAQTGLRFGELAGLHWNRVDLDRGVVAVVEVFDEEVGDIKAQPKGKRRRDVPVPGWVADLLAARERPSGACPVPHRSGRCGSPLVFSGPAGGVLWRSNWDTVFRGAVRAAGIEAATIHDLRHTYGSWLVQRGVPLVEVARLMGHLSTATTQRYAHLAPRDDSSVLDALPAPRLLHEDDPLPR